MTTDFTNFMPSRPVCVVVIKVNRPVFMESPAKERTDFDIWATVASHQNIFPAVLVDSDLPG